MSARPVLSKIGCHVLAETFWGLAIIIVITSVRVSVEEVFNFREEILDFSTIEETASGVAEAKILPIHVCLGLQQPHTQP